ncbi:hypothetical protein IS519_12490 [Vibrio crassostreae]|uniref:hypothetical protein n=1 Tax=Vibrio crassostreae TaxID=246167 RepID=UPI002009F0F0|nr:hypothetical protein [Vibrio crassostreae]UPR28979.1 hypothetical protein IS519_12490 [Vibrio crassostreae]
MKNAWDKIERERKSHYIKRTYSFSPANLKAIKSQAHMRKVTIEKHLNDLIAMAGEQLKQLLEQERTERKNYRIINKNLRAQNKNYPMTIVTKKTSLEKLENQVENLESKLKESKASELKALSLLDCEKKKRK